MRFRSHSIVVMWDDDLTGLVFNALTDSNLRDNSKSKKSEGVFVGNKNRSLDGTCTVLTVQYWHVPVRQPRPVFVAISNYHRG
jgi:hypothetical protein